MSFDLTGKVVWITGAGKGIGRALAVALADAGATLAITARTSADLEDLASTVGGDVLLAPGSVDDSAFAESCAERIVTELGQLDVLVNCAGISPTFKRSESGTDEEWRRVLSVNLDGTYFCSRAAGRRMLEQRAGSIINVSSVHGRSGFDRIAAYAASKGGVEALTRVLAVEWADRGVRVNTLAPGYFRTDLSSGLMDSRWGETILNAIPQRRIGTADELAGAAIYLASDASSYVTGSTLTVDGGWLAH